MRKRSGNSAVPAQRPHVLVTMGDPNGIGPEIILRMIESPAAAEARLTAIGDPSVFQATAARMGIDLATAESTGQLAIEPTDPPSGFTWTPGTVDPDAGRIAMQAVEWAVDACRDERADAMVTAPISKEAVRAAGYDIHGHTEFIAERCGAERPLMMLVSSELRVGLVTTHIPLGAVPARMSRDAILDRLRTMRTSLVRDYGIPRPRIAVFGLNPHAGEGGSMGTEETDHIEPALEAAREAGIDATGPFPADGFFGSGAWKGVDAILAMYHDQGLAPFKALAFGSGVNHTAGLPIIRTSPDHGTAFDIAGKGLARASSMEAAVRLATSMAIRRNADD